MHIRRFHVRLPQSHTPGGVGIPRVGRVSCLWQFSYTLRGALFHSVLFDTLFVLQYQAMQHREHRSNFVTGVLKQ